MAVLKDTTVVGNLNVSGTINPENLIINLGSSPEDTAIGINRSSGGDTMIKFNRTDTNVGLSVGIGSGGTNHGVWTNAMDRWMIYCDKTKTYIPGTINKIEVQEINLLV